MKVLQLIDTLDAGGAERMAVNIANAIAEKGFKSYVCSTRRGGALEQELEAEVTLFLLGKKGTLDLRAFRRFFKWLRKEEIDIIHAHSTSVLLASLAKINNRRLKIVWHDHYGLSNAIQQRPKRALKVIAKYIDAVIAVNKTLKTWSEKVLGIEKVVFLNNFAQLSQGTPSTTALEGINGKRVVCLANLRPQKNHLELITAFKESIALHPEWTLHLVGKSFNDAYAQSIKILIAKESLEQSVFLYGSRNDVSAILKQATIGVLASVSEGLPVSLLEYGNSSLPVIVTDVGQCAEVVGEQGRVIHNVLEELPEALIHLYNNHEREVMGNRFRESVKNTYSKEAFMTQLIPIYKALVSLE